MCRTFVFPVDGVRKYRQDGCCIESVQQRACLLMSYAAIIVPGCLLRYTRGDVPLEARFGYTATYPSPSPPSAHAMTVRAHPCLDGPRTHLFPRCLVRTAMRCPQARGGAAAAAELGTVRLPPHDLLVPRPAQVHQGGGGASGVALDPCGHEHVVGPPPSCCWPYYTASQLSAHGGRAKGVDLHLVRERCVSA